MINFILLQEAIADCAGRVKYLLGAKVPLDFKSEQIKKIDCSGWVRWLIHLICGIKLPDGSQNQLSYCKSHFRQLAKYSDVLYAAEDSSRLFIAFLSPKPGQEWPRHVWLIWKGRTVESAGGKGVCQRDWNTGILKNCVACFEVKV